MIESGTPPIILIVDDEPSNIQVLAQVLQPDYQVRFTTRGNKAVALAESQHPEIILMDVVMPDMDGYAVCKLLKENEATRDIPVIFVTAMGEEQYEESGFDVGGVDYITKPVKPFLLRARIRTHLELKRQKDILKSLSNHDGLTGIANRRRLDEYIEQEWQRAVRCGHSCLSCIMMDVDFFKRYNDGYSHPVGDDCLRRIAEALKSTMSRGTDLVARYGGEEFVCILPETSARGANQIAEKILDTIVTLAIPHEFSDVCSFVTVSAGVATMLPTKDQTPSKLLELADIQLYRAKQEGRNRVCCVDLTPNEQQLLGVESRAIA